jgi:hypothetical protein
MRRVTGGSFSADLVDRIRFGISGVRGMKTSFET